MHHFSRISEMNGRADTSLQFVNLYFSPFLNIREIPANINLSGNRPLFNEKLKKYFNGFLIMPNT